MAQDDRKSLISRIGTFFTVLGLLGLTLFVVSDITKNTNPFYFVLAIVLFVAGWFLKQKSATPPAADKRFEGVRKMQQNRREAKAKSDKNKKK